MKVALIQFDAIPEKPKRNLKKILELINNAKTLGAKIIMFHEGTISDYVFNVDKFAEIVPTGMACKSIGNLAKKLKVYVSFGLIEKDKDKRYITQVFFGPKGFIYKYRKTWLYRTKKPELVKRFRNEWAQFDPGNGPEIFNIAGIKSTCLICVDGNSQRCLDTIKKLKPQLVFYPNNRGRWQPHQYFEKKAKFVRALLLVTNRVGKSWTKNCIGGCAVYSKNGKLLASANQKGKEEILIFDLKQLNL